MVCNLSDNLVDYRLLQLVRLVHHISDRVDSPLQEFARFYLNRGLPDEPEKRQELLSSTGWPLKILVGIILTATVWLRGSKGQLW